MPDDASDDLSWLFDGEPDRDRFPTPGERLLYALGQLYRLLRVGELPVAPGDFDVWDLAGIIGVRDQVEFISEDARGSHWHFQDEVLVVELYKTCARRTPQGRRVGHLRSSATRSS